MDYLNYSSYTAAPRSRRSRFVVGSPALLALASLLATGCDGRNLVGYQNPDGPTGDGATPYSDAGTPPYSDAGTPNNGLSDAHPSSDAPDVTQVGPTYACGPAGAGLTCSCGLQPYFPSPVNAQGQQQTYVLPPDPATVVSYATQAAFDALAVGRWQRIAGSGEMICEQVGVDFTADHRIIPLVTASDGSVQEVTALGKTVFVVFSATNGPQFADSITGMGYTAAPTFFDGGQSMYMLIAPWPADYVRLPSP
jgi:hypothetical protein